MKTCCKEELVLSIFSAVCGLGNQNFVEIAVVNLNADISKRAGRDDAFSF